VQICSVCGEENPDRARFCQSCAIDLLSETGTTVRKTVTVVFCDIVGSTALGDRIDPESLRRIMQGYFARARAVIERHGGTVEKFIGDAVMAVFGVPRLHEDDPLRAVRAAAELREALSALDRGLEQGHGGRLQARIGINTGEVVAGDHLARQTLVTGDAVNIAARLEQAASPGDILIGEATHRQVHHAVTTTPAQTLELRGKADPIRAFRLMSVHPVEKVIARNVSTRLVGRKPELRILHEAFDRATENRSCQLVTVMGMPGIGKTRLVQEHISSLQNQATVLWGRCLPYGDGITFWPIADIVRQVAAITQEHSSDQAASRIKDLLRHARDGDLIAERVAAAIGFVPGAPAIEETFWAIRRLLEAIAAQGPLMVVFDDIQWGEATFLDLVEYLVSLTTGVPMLLTCMARPDLLDARPGWTVALPNAATLTLDALSDSQTEALVKDLLGGDVLSHDARVCINKMAGGNPLFLEELLTMLIDDGILRDERGRWHPTTDLTTVPIPDSIIALLSARLDRLVAEERALIERASIVGEVFTWGAVAALSSDSGRPDIGSNLMSLVRRDLIRPEPSDITNEDAFRFRHVLIRDVAYQGIPKSVRANLHERFADWLERTTRDQLSAWEEIVGFHLEQASLYRRELDPRGEIHLMVGHSAARHLSSAAERALALSDPPAAASLLDRSIALLPKDDPARAWLLPKLLHALTELNDADRVGVAVTEMLRSAEAIGDEALLAWAHACRVTGLLLRQPSAITLEEGRAAYEKAIAAFEEVGNSSWLSLTLQSLSQLEFLVGQVGAAMRTNQRALLLARESGDPYVTARGSRWRPVLMDYGTTRAPAAIEETKMLLDAEGSPVTQLELLAELAIFQAMIGDAAGASESIRRGEDLQREIRSPWHRDQFHWAVGQVSWLLGDKAKAERKLSATWEAISNRGDTAEQALLAWDLGRLMCELGDFRGATRIAKSVRAGSAAYFRWAEIVWRGLLAIVESRSGSFDEARVLSEGARKLVSATDFLNLRADLALSHAKILFLAGRHSDALSAVDEAIVSYGEKGNVVSGALARSLKDEIEADS
jgi:predicted ATPase/class 3 adenylate cyclase